MSNDTGRRGRGEGSIKQLENGRWMVRVTLSPLERRTIYGDSKADVLSKMRQAHTKAEKGEVQTDARITIATFMAEWLEDTARTKVRSSTFRAYEHYVKAHIIPGIGRHRLARLTPEHVDKFLAECAKPRPGAKG